jgi:hypothetical protein
MVINTHGIGLSRRKVIREMTECGFSEVTALAPKFNNFISPTGSLLANELAFAGQGVLYWQRKPFRPSFSSRIRVPAKVRRLPFSVGSDLRVKSFVTAGTKRYEILFVVVSKAAAGLNMMDLKIL